MKRDAKKLLLILGFALSLAICFDYLFYNKVPGVSVPIFAVLVIGSMFILVRHFKVKLEYESALLAITVLLLSLLSFLRANPALVVLDISVMLYLFLLLLGRLLGLSLLRFTVKDYIVAAFRTPMLSVAESLWTYEDLFKSRRELRSNKILDQVGRGVAITMPAIVIFILLFSSADLVFSKYTNHIIEKLVQWDSLAHLAIIVIVTTAFTGAFAFVFYRHHEEKYRKIELGATTDSCIANNHKAISFIESSILLGSINSLFVLFIFIQFTYLFGGVRNIIGQGFSYAEYAHRGFFELIAVAVISLVIIWATDVRVDKSSPRQARWFKSLSAILIVLVSLIMVSAFKRLSIYESAYGYTFLRVYVQVFIVMLGVIFVFMLLKILFDRHEAWFTLRAFAVSVAFLIGLNVLNMDALIARQNINRFKVTHKEELLMYTGDLSEDAVDEMLTAYSLLKSPNNKRELSEKIKGYFNNTKGKPWQSYSLSRSNTYRQLSNWEVDFNVKKS